MTASAAPTATRTRFRCSLCGAARRSTTVPVCSGGSIKHRATRMQATS